MKIGDILFDIKGNEREVIKIDGNYFIVFGLLMLFDKKTLFAHGYYQSNDRLFKTKELALAASNAEKLLNKMDK